MNLSGQKLIEFLASCDVVIISSRRFMNMADSSLAMTEECDHLSEACDRLSALVDDLRDISETDLPAPRP